MKTINYLFEEIINWRFSDSDRNEYLRLDETGLKVSFAGPYRFGTPPMIHTEYPICRPREFSKRGKFTIKMIVVTGGNDNSIAVGLRIKQYQPENVNDAVDSFTIKSKSEVKTWREEKWSPGLKK